MIVIARSPSPNPRDGTTWRSLIVFQSIKDCFVPSFGTRNDKFNMNLSKEQIEHIANLARLDLTEEELKKYGEQLSAVLGYVDQLGEVETKRIEPTAQVTGLENVFRKDEVEEWSREEIEEALEDAPEREDRFIKVKRVLE